MSRSKLGERFKAAVAEPAAPAGAGAGASTERQVSPEVAAARKTNEELMDELMELAGELEGLVNGTRLVRKVVLERLGHKLVFAFAADRARASVRWPGGHEKDYTFFKNGVWHMAFHEPRIKSVHLFDDGLEYLMVKGLGMPRPGSNKTVTPLPSTSPSQAGSDTTGVPGSAVQELDELW